MLEDALKATGPSFHRFSFQQGDIKFEVKMEHALRLDDVQAAGKHRAGYFRRERIEPVRSKMELPFIGVFIGEHGLHQVAIPGLGQHLEREILIGIRPDTDLPHLLEISRNRRSGGGRQAQHQRVREHAQGVVEPGGGTSGSHRPDTDILQPGERPQQKPIGARKGHEETDARLFGKGPELIGKRRIEIDPYMPGNRPFPDRGHGMIQGQDQGFRSCQHLLPGGLLPAAVIGSDKRLHGPGIVGVSRRRRRKRLRVIGLLDIVGQAGHGNAVEGEVERIEHQERPAAVQTRQGEPQQGGPAQIEGPYEILQNRFRRTAGAVDPFQEEAGLLLDPGAEFPADNPVGGTEDIMPPDQFTQGNLQAVGVDVTFHHPGRRHVVGALVAFPFHLGEQAAFDRRQRTENFLATAGKGKASGAKGMDAGLDPGDDRLDVLLGVGDGQATGPAFPGIDALFQEQHIEEIQLQGLKERAVPAEAVELELGTEVTDAQRHRLALEPVIQVVRQHFGQVIGGRLEVRLFLHQFHGGTDRGQGKRMPAERAAEDDHVRFRNTRIAILPGASVHMVQVGGLAADDADGHPAPDDLAVQRHVGLDIEMGLGAAGADPEPVDHLIEDQGHPLLLRQGPQFAQEGVGLERGAPALDRLHQDGSQRARGGQFADTLKAFLGSIIEDDQVFHHPGRGPGGLRGHRRIALPHSQYAVGDPVIGPAEHHHLPAPGMGTRQAQRQHDRLAAGIAERDALTAGQAGYPAGGKPRQIRLRPEFIAFRQLPFQGGKELRVPMPEKVHPHPQGNINIRIPVNVAEGGPGRTGRHDGIRGILQGLAEGKRAFPVGQDIPVGPHHRAGTGRPLHLPGQQRLHKGLLVDGQFIIGQLQAADILVHAAGPGVHSRRNGRYAGRNRQGGREGGGNPRSRERLKLLPEKILHGIDLLNEQRQRGSGGYAGAGNRRCPGGRLHPWNSARNSRGGRWRNGIDRFRNTLFPDKSDNLFQGRQVREEEAHVDGDVVDRLQPLAQLDQHQRVETQFKQVRLGIKALPGNREDLRHLVRNTVEYNLVHQSWFPAEGTGRRRP